MNIHSNNLPYLGISYPYNLYPSSNGCSCLGQPSQRVSRIDPQLQSLIKMETV